MKRSFMIIVIIVMLTLTATVFAGTYRAVTKDTTCAPGGSCYDNYGVYLQASNNLAGSCVPTYVGYIGWDLTSESRTWQSASLKLRHYKTTGGENPFTFKIYPANNDTWTEDGTDPGYDDTQELATADYNDPNTTLTFSSDALGTYFLNKKGGLASIAVVMTDGCGPVSGTVEFEDMEGSGHTLAPTSANEPDLIFWTGSGATAVTLHSMDSQTINWPLYVGLVALFALVVAGVGFGVRRSNS